MSPHHLLSLLRAQARHPVVAVATLATLALGLGLNAAIFSIAYGVLKPLAYPSSHELVRLHHTYDVLKRSPNPRLQAIWNRLPVSYLEAVELRQTEDLASLGLYTRDTVTYNGGAEPVELVVSRVDEHLFSVLGAEPSLGRGFESTDVDPQAQRVVLSHELWLEAFGGDPGALGASLRLDDIPYTVIGVMPAGFGIIGHGSVGHRIAASRLTGHLEDRLWLPLQVSSKDRTERDNWRYEAVARLPADGSLDAAQTAVDQLAAGLAEAYPESHAEAGFHLVPLLDQVVGTHRPLLLLLMAAVAAVLFIACVNVAHLLLARTAQRRHELAVRAALGAGRLRLGGQLMAESVLLAATGGLLGLGLAYQAHAVLLAWIPADLPRTADISMGRDVAFFTVLLSLLTGVLAGLLPAILGSRISAQDLSASRSTANAGGRLAHSTLVVAEIALTLVLTAAASLLVGSFFRLTAVDPGFRPQQVLVQELRLPDWRYSEPEARQAFAERLLDRAPHLPGVESTALTSKLPLPGPSLVTGYHVPGRGDRENDWTQGRSAAITFVTPEYFQTLGIPVLEGRSFAEADRQGTQTVAVISRLLAEQNWPTEDAVGQEILIRNDEAYTVVGVVEDVRQEGFAKTPGGVLYLSWHQPWNGMPSNSLFAVHRIADAPVPTADAVNAAVRQLDPLLPVDPAVNLASLVRQSLSLPRSRTALVGLFAALALLLTLVGTYAVMSFSVSRRVREIGIRATLGATARRLRSLVLVDTLRLALLGIALGLSGALASARLLRSFLYEIEPTNLTFLGSTAALLTAIALAGGYLPARRASRIDPVEALRSE
ncbi:MAG: ADOP family duplicated permease [Acidobacteriota bacterium]